MKNHENDEAGFPMIRVPKYSHTKEKIQAYLKKWQKPSILYSGRLGITLNLPSDEGDLDDLISDEVCPIYTNEEINLIRNRILERKEIPILEYSPSGLYYHTKKVWWIVPFCIWKEEIVSMVFIDKNGFYGVYDSDGSIDIQMIFPWDKVTDVEFEHSFDDDPQINRLTLYAGYDTYLTFDEFVSDDTDDNHGSYLSIIEAIWEVRRETIEASKNEPFWIEGAGGESFKVYNSSRELRQEDLYDKIKNIKDSFKVLEFIEENKEEIDIEISYGFIRDELKTDPSILHYFLSNGQFIFKFFPKSVRQDKTFILDWIERTKQELKDAEELKNLNPENEENIKSYEDKNRAAGFAPWILTQIDESLVGDEDLLQAALTCKYVSFIKGLDVDQWNINGDWAIKAAKINIHSVYYLPKELKNDPELCKDLLSVHLSAYNFFEEEMKRNKEVQTFALRKDGYVFQIFPDDLKCDKAYIKNMLEDCWDNDDLRGYMIFNVCESLKNDQELIDLAIERNSYIFERVVSASDYTKEVFKQYLIVSPHIHRYVPDEWKDDRDLILSLLSGGFDDQRRVSIFSNSKWYDDIQFARDLVITSDYSYSLQFLKKEFQYLPEIVSLFLNKFSDSEYIAVLPAKELGLDFFKPIIKENLKALFFIKDREIANTLLLQYEEEALKLVQFSDLKLFDSMRVLSMNPKVFRAVMKNPLITNRYLQYPPYDIQQDEELMMEIESLSNHLKNEFFNDRFNRNKDRYGITFSEKSEARLNYVKTLNGDELSIFTLLFSDPSHLVRKEAAKKIQLSEELIEKIIKDGTPLVTYYKYGASKIINKHDVHVLRGIILNDSFDKFPDSAKNEIIKLEKEASCNQNSLKVSLKFPKKYLEYDDVESLWHWGISGSSNIEVDFENLELLLDDDDESIINNFKKVFDEENTKNVLYKWIAEILIECDKYYVESIQNIDGGNFFISHAIVQFSVKNNQEMIFEFEKQLNELIEIHSPDEIVNNFKSSNSSI